MDFLLGTTVAFFFFSLLWAALMDAKTGEVPNKTWIPAFCAFPLAVYRLALASLLASYALQVVFIFALVLLCFHLGLLGGADGKAILFMSLTYPWLEIDRLLLSIGSVLACLGAWIIGGFESLGLAFLNLYGWHRLTLSQRQMSHPERKRFWFTRRFVHRGEKANPPAWKNVPIPFVLYILFAYLLLLVCNKPV